MRTDITPVWTQVVVTPRGMFCAFIHHTGEYYEGWAFGGLTAVVTSARFCHAELDMVQSRVLAELEEVITLSTGGEGARLPACLQPPAGRGPLEVPTPAGRSIVTQLLRQLGWALDLSRYAGGIQLPDHAANTARLEAHRKAHSDIGRLLLGTDYQPFEEPT